MRGMQGLQGKGKSSVIGVGFAGDVAPNRRGAFARWIRGNVFLPDARIGWIPSATRAARLLLRKNKFNVVMTTGPPHSAHLIGKRIARSTGMPWVVDMRDPWTDTYYAEELAQSWVARKVDRYTEAGRIVTGPRCDLRQ